VSVTVLHGDMLERLAELPDASVDSCVCDPPYGITFMGKRWDHGVPGVDYWRAVYRVLKPGAHVFAFGGTRTFHRLVCAIEDAGLEIRDQYGWMFATGFPKSLNLSKAIDKSAGAVGTLGEYRSPDHAVKRKPGKERRHEGYQRPWMDDAEAVDAAARQYIPATPEAAKWQGWGTAAKPSFEPICLARKPLDGTVAGNVLKWGTGAINVDACRVEGEPWAAHRATGLAKVKFFTDGAAPMVDKAPHDAGRWPSNVLHDGSPEVMAAFARFGESVSPSKAAAAEYVPNGKNSVYGKNMGGGDHAGHADSGTAARFFPALGFGDDDLRFWYGGKADADDRLKSRHPTVKPVALMRWLVRLVTPPGGTVLDPFAGTGTTGAAAIREGFHAVLVEREAEYVADIKARLAHIEGADTPLFAGAAE